MADFENTVPQDTVYANATGEETLTETRVWAAAMCPAIAKPLPVDVITNISLGDFMYDVFQTTPSGAEIYFHNLSYDGAMVVSWLLAEGWEYRPVEGRAKNPDPMCFDALIDDSGGYYKISVSTEGSTHFFIDSLKIIPVSLDSMGKAFGTQAQKLVGEIDYQKPRPDGYLPTEEEWSYVENDVLVLAEVIHLLRQEEVDITKSLTIGAACMKQYKRTLGKGNSRKGSDRFNSMFPQIDPEVDAELRKAYHGGWCYVNDRHPSHGKIVDMRGHHTLGHTIDVVSLYPSAMYNRRFPIGQPLPIDAEKFDPDTYRGEFIVKVRTNFRVKDNHVPFLQLKKSSRFADNDYPRDSEGVVELTMTRPAWELFNEQYDTDTEPVVVAAWGFDSVDNPFNEYIDYWFEIKSTTKNPVLKIIAKLMLNNLYGKMAQGFARDGYAPYLNEDGVLKYDLVKDEGNAGHIAAGAYITDYARCVTVRAAQANYDIFLYADTDSLHCAGVPVDVPLSHNLGEWELESRWDMGRFVRQKTYIERVVEAETKNLETGKKEVAPVTPHLLMRAAGASQQVKDRLLKRVTEYTPTHGWTHQRETDNAGTRTHEEVIKRYTFGLTEAGKLTRRLIKGGPVLITTTFAIRGGDTPIDPETGVGPTEWWTP